MKNLITDVTFQNNVKNNEAYLMAVACKLSGNYDDAQDLVQDTWVRIIENYPDYDNRNRFRNWATVIMKNIFINKFRSLKRRGVSVDIDNARLYASVSMDEDFTGQYVLKAIAKMPHEMSSVFYLYLQGYTYEEISHRVAIPLGTVKSRIFCTKKRLQAILKPLR